MWDTGWLQPWRHPEGRVSRELGLDWGRAGDTIQVPTSLEGGGGLPSARGAVKAPHPSERREKGRDGLRGGLKGLWELDLKVEAGAAFDF